MQLPIGKVTRRLSTQVHTAPRTVINIGQRPILNVAPVYSKISTTDLPLLQLLQGRFTLEDPRYKYLKKHRGDALKWDGKVEFLRRKGGEGVFLTGLLPEITKKLDELGVQFDLYDNRPYPEEDLSDAVNADTLQKGSIKLHDYQVEIANVALTQRNGIVKCATGGGKTVIFASMLKALEGKKFPALLLFRNKTLVTQTYDLLHKCGIQGLGRVNMDFNEPGEITCSTMQSIAKVGSLSKYKMLIVDEVHEFGSTKSIATLRLLNSTVWRLGFSATPFKENDKIRNMYLTGIFGPLLCDISTESLTSRNILADAKVQIYKVTQPTNIKFLQPWAAAEEAGIVNNATFNRQVADIVNSIPEGRIMILVRRLAHGDALSKLIPDAYWIQGQDSAETREFVLSQLRENRAGRKKVVAIVSAIGYIGLNVYVHHLINCTGGKDANGTIQKLGRGLRRAPDKSSVVYHDFQFENNMFLKSHSEARIKTLEQEGHPITYV